ncbi:unnamed protein product, partial [Ectocarpus sp. 12 AP-2014]
PPSHTTHPNQTLLTRQQLPIESGAKHRHEARVLKRRSAFSHEVSSRAADPSLPLQLLIPVLRHCSMITQRTASKTHIMSLPASIVLPNTPEGETVRRYALGQSDASYFGEGAAPIFSKDMVFNGLLFKLQGAANIVPLFADFVANKIKEVRRARQTSQHAIAEAGSKKKYLVLYYVRLEGQEIEMPLVDLLTLDDEGLICRLENCFDTTKCPQEIIDAGAPTLVGFEG